MALKHYSEPLGTAGEVLVVRGVLTDDLRFQPVMCGSEFRRPDLVSCCGSDVELRLLDDKDRVLISEPAGLQRPTDCSPHKARSWILEGCVPLIKGAATLAIYKGTIEVARLDVGDRPKLKIEWKENQVKRGAKYRLTLDYSKPTEDALVKVFYQWGPAEYLLAGCGKPKKETEIDFDSLPGGKECHIIVVYSSGLRSVVAKSPAFSVPPLEPEVKIVRPRRERVFAPWHPVELEARIHDRQGASEPT